MEVLLPILTMAVLGFLFSVGLAVAYQKLKVEEDPRVVAISESLPQANCGACGYSGCRAFAESVAKGDAPATGCPVEEAKPLRGSPRSWVSKPGKWSARSHGCTAGETKRLPRNGVNTWD